MHNEAHPARTILQNKPARQPTRHTSRPTTPGPLRQKTAKPRTKMRNDAQSGSASHPVCAKLGTGICAQQCTMMHNNAQFLVL
jgi:hypothetical protein